jgi:hypothetical protein
MKVRVSDGRLVEVNSHIFCGGMTLEVTEDWARPLLQKGFLGVFSSS